MTSAHSMFVKKVARCRVRLSALILLISFMAAILAACASKDKLYTPTRLSSPYERTQLWAVAPFMNESGVSLVRTDRIADAFAEQAEDIEGISMLPVNRVITTMNRLNLRTIGSHQDAIALLNALNIDGLIVGTVTAYDPYRPLKLGAAVQLYRRETTQGQSVDPVQLTRAANETPAANNAAATPFPAARASGMFDASNHQVLLWLDEYSRGRAEPGSAYGTRIYLTSMEMYTQFVAYRLLHDLLAVEQARHQALATQQK
jgi:hypothetical protein